MRGRRSGGSIRRDFVRGSLKTMGLLAVIGALVIVVVRHGGAMAGLYDHEQLSLLYRGGLLILVGSALARMFRDRFGGAIRGGLVGVVVALVLAVSYTHPLRMKDAGHP